MTGWATFLREYLRRDRWLYLWWGLGAVALYYSQAVSVKGLYTTQAEFDAAAASMEHNAAFIAMAGPARALNTIGGQVVWQAAAFGAVLSGLMSMFLVGRHTRAEEESGRDELLRGSPVGRHASLTAALVDALLANVVLGVLVAASLVSFPLAVPDSVAVGAGLTLSGWCFTGAAVVAAQLTSTTRGMYGLMGAVLGVAYAVRAVGDVTHPWLSWLSPIGWYQAMHAFSGLRWWPALLLLAAAAVSVLAGFLLFGVRDFGAGLWAARPGPARADPRLRSPWGFAWDLQRASVVGWTVGMFLLGVVFGSMGNDVGTLVGDSKGGEEIFVQGGGSMVDGFYAVSAAMLGLVATGFAVSSALRPRSEEDDGRVEPLLGTALSRGRWWAAQVAVTVAGALAVLLAAGVGLAVGFWSVTGDGGRSGTFVGSTLLYIAPLLVLSGLTRLLYGVAPRWAYLSWLGVVLGFVVLFFGPLLRLPGWVQDLSPYHHVPLVPAQSFETAPFVALLLLAALLSVAGRLAFLRRDVG